MDQKLRPLYSVLRAESIGAIVGGVLLLAFAVAVELPESKEFCEAINMEEPGGAIWVMRGLALFLALPALYFLRKGLTHWNVARHPLWRLLTERPNDLVWV